MNVFNKVTSQSLKKNKVRTIVTIIGIMLSAAMICAVTTFISSVQNYLLNYIIYIDGDWHGSAENIDYNAYTEIVNSDKVADATYNRILGYAKIDSQNEFKPYMYVIGGSQESFFERMPIHLVSGNYPESSNEIIIPEHILYNGGMKYKVGDTITLELGNRMLDGFVMTQDNPCYTWSEESKDDVLNDETIEIREVRTYTVVGIFERPTFEGRTAPGYTAITVSNQLSDSSLSMDVYYKMNNPSEVYDFIDTMQFNASVNNDILTILGVSRYDSFTSMLMGLIVIVIGLIMFGSVSLIYNAFAISVSERTKQFGLLSSVGATKKQLKRMVFFEALEVSIIGIPLGIGVGIAGIAVTLLLIGNKFTAMVGDYDAPMRICVSWEAIVIAAVVALITVLISAWIPSRRAKKVSAVEAIRQNADIKANNRPVKTSKLTYKLFGLPGVLANKHYKRNKKKYRTTVVSLFMSIVLFVSAAAFTDYIMETVTGGFGTDNYEIRYQIYEEEFDGKTAEEVLEIMTSDKNVTNGAYTLRWIFSGLIPSDYLTEQYCEMAGENDEDGTHTMSGACHFVNDEAFNKLLSDNNLDRAEFYNPANPVGVVIDQSTYFDIKQEKYITLDALKTDNCEVSCMRVNDKYNDRYYAGERENENGDIMVIYRNPENDEDIIEVPFDEAYNFFTLKSVKTITEAPFYVSKAGSMVLNMLYPVSMLDSVIPEALRQGQSYNYYLQSDDHAASYTRLKTMLSENSLDSMNLYDYAENEERDRNVVNIIQVFAYGFIVLISLIAAANVFNTISTNISLRRREFAMLKSVGMTQKGFNRMMNFECLLYGSKALIYGLPVSAVITYFIYLATSNGFGVTYRLPWGAVGIAVLSVFLVVFSTMLYSMSKIKKENPIDALKNENL